MDAWLIETMRHAGQIALDFFEGTFEVKTKPDGSPVTTADLAVDRFLREQLGQRYPEDCLLSEETEDDPRRSESRRVWIIDPIDGTSYFAARKPEFGVLAALVVDGIAEESVAYFPKMDILLASKRGEGAFVNGRRVRVSPVTGAQAKVACKPGPFQSLNTAPQVIKNNALEVFRVITGETEGCVVQTSPSTGEHDYAWASIAIEEAGGRMTDTNNEALRYNKPIRKMPPVLICSNRLVHDTILAGVRRLQSST
ncbi:MAG: hypothetical protein K1Y02_18680 [Candidatus Hydrogenedentes bacterium]|nr:hypothetical protein [Candidatus Hydrogenedentota bacterium]